MLTGFQVFKRQNIGDIHSSQICQESQHFLQHLSGKKNKDDINRMAD